MKRTKQIDIKHALALASAFHFLSSFARACLLPFLTLFFRQLGLTPAMTGIVMGTKHSVSLVWSPAAALLSKHYNKRRAVINASLVASAAVALLLLLLPPADVNTRVSSCVPSDLSVSPNKSVDANLLVNTTAAPGPLSNKTHPEAPVTPSAVTSNASAAPDMKSPVTARNHSLHQHDPAEPSKTGNTSVEVNSSLSTGPEVNSSSVRNTRSEVAATQGQGENQESGSDFLGSLKAMDAQHQLFFMVLLIVVLWELVACPLEWTVDDGLYEYLDFADASDRYSSSGPWGLVGAACGVGGAGLLVSKLNCFIAAETPRSAAHFYMYAGLVALILPAAVSLPLHITRKHDRANRLLKAVQLVRGSPRALLCAVTTLLVGAAGSAVDNFLLWQIQDHGGSELHMGLALAVALLSQAAFPLLAGRVSKLLSPGRMLAVGAAMLGLQCLYYSFLWAAWAALPAQLLSCFGSGALWWAVKVQCEDVAMAGAERNVRRVYSSLCLHLGAALGSFAAGFVVQRVGLAWLFRGAAAALALWCVLLPLLQWKAPRQRRINYSRLLAAEASEASDSESEQENDWLDKAMEPDGGSQQNGRRAKH
ncbi:major facilitator superfamily domain-containing protein 6-like [Stegastes partitus]|uniref:Major facilitator superfamily domain-containing protein 6-like n=1 Tax=Stegastes partitus TaxID=144197 RepID=A0A9Y4JYU3_9TELE|nr:PREDICTED: major facilitator superfamily domain-containing protein 6-like [Stegastes partitus]